MPEPSPLLVLPRRRRVRPRRVQARMRLVRRVRAPQAHILASMLHSYIIFYSTTHTESTSMSTALPSRATPCLPTGPIRQQPSNPTSTRPRRPTARWTTQTAVMAVEAEQQWTLRRPQRRSGFVGGVRRRSTRRWRKRRGARRASAACELVCALLYMAACRLPPHN